MKKLALIPLTISIVLAISILWFFYNIQPVASVVNLIDFNIPKGVNASGIGERLFEKGLIKNPLVFRVYVQFSGISSNIQAGDYRLSPSFNLFQTIDVLSKNPIAIKVTIPEGYTNAEIAAKFAKSLDKDKTFINDFLSISKKDEGYLFPDTYLITNNATPGAIVAKMKAEFVSKTADLKPIPSQVIMASIIERETKGVEERPIVAGILMNRLEAGMPLQVDVAPETYKTPGLPSSPIANPGLISISAAVHPIATDYWYYLHDSTGVIHYAKTLDEQNINIAKYLK